MTKPPLLASPDSPLPLPLASRADRFGPVGKCVEEMNAGRWGNGTGSSFQSDEKQCIAMNLAVKDALMKETLMDRVRSLENRLLQLCMELESRGMSLPDTPLFQAFKETASAQRRSNNNAISSSSSSLGCRPNRNQTKTLTTSFEATIDKAKVKDKSDGNKKKTKKVADEPKKKAMKCDGESKAVTLRKKGNKPSTWFHLNLLGC